MIWKDATSYSQGQKDRTPTCWEGRTKHLRVIVHFTRYDSGWYLSCYDLGIRDQKLAGATPELAQAEALLKLEVYLLALAAEIAEARK